MLILLLLEKFEMYHKSPNNPINIYEDSITNFKLSWMEYCEGKDIKKLHKSRILNFLKHLGKPLGKIKKKFG